MAVDSNTDKLIILVYRAMAGGKLIANALALSDSAVLQAWWHILDDHGALHSVQWKYNHLVRKIKESYKTDWLDLELGCIQMFGELVKGLGTAGMPYIGGESHSNLDFNSDMVQICEGFGQHYFVVCHDRIDIRYLLNRRPFANIIIFDNQEEFLDKYDNRVINGDLTPTPWDLKNHKGKIFRWNCLDSVETSDIFAEKIQLLADDIGIKNIDKELVTSFHTLWYDRRIKTEYKNGC